jgi:hypothetical protein
MGEYNVLILNAKMPDNLKVEQFCSPFLSHYYIISTFEGLNFILKLHYNVKKISHIISYPGKNEKPSMQAPQTS